MNMSTPLDRLPDDQDTLNNIKEVPPAKEISLEGFDSEVSIDNTSDEDLTFRGSDRDWTRSAISFLLIIFVFLLFIYWGIQNRPNLKGSGVPQMVMAENSMVDNPHSSSEVVKPEKPVPVEDSLGSDHPEKTRVRVVIQKNAENNDDLEMKKHRLAEDSDKEIKQLSGIMEIIRQTDEVIEYILSE